MGPCYVADSIPGFGWGVAIGGVAMALLFDRIRRDSSPADDRTTQRECEFPEPNPTVLPTILSVIINIPGNLWCSSGCGLS